MWNWIRRIIGTASGKPIAPVDDAQSGGSEDEKGRKEKERQARHRDLEDKANEQGRDRGAQVVTAPPPPRKASIQRGAKAKKLEMAEQDAAMTTALFGVTVMAFRATMLELVKSIGKRILTEVIKVGAKAVASAAVGGLIGGPLGVATSVLIVLTLMALDGKPAHASGLPDFKAKLVQLGQQCKLKKSPLPKLEILRQMAVLVYRMQLHIDASMNESMRGGTAIYHRNSDKRASMIAHYTNILDIYAKSLKQATLSLSKTIAAAELILQDIKESHNRDVNWMANYRYYNNIFQHLKTHSQKFKTRRVPLNRSGAERVLSSSTVVELW